MPKSFGQKCGTFIGVLLLSIPMIIAIGLLVLCLSVECQKQRDIARYGSDLGRRLHQPRSDHVMDLIGGLGRCGAQSTYAVPDLIKVMLEKDYSQNDFAATALGKIGPVTENVIPALIEALDIDDRYLQAAAAEALGRIGPMAEEAGSALVSLLEDGDDSARAAAAYALVDIGVHVTSAMPVLVEELNHGLPVDRQVAVIYLGRIGPPAKGALPKLLELSKHKDKHLQLAVRSAIVAIRGEDPKPCIDEVVSYIEKGKACFVVGILGMFGHDANSVAPILFKELKAPQKYYRAEIEIVKVLPKICTNKKQLIEAMISCFGHNIDRTHEMRSAMEGLCPEAVPALEKLASEYSGPPEYHTSSGAETILVGFKLKSEVRRSQLAKKTATRPAR